ncbi:MAG: gluconolactonase [Bacteroidetes bacterium]|nr:MAG: gluconolactonase [Bacteroidota bacterium]
MKSRLYLMLLLSVSLLINFNQTGFCQVRTIGQIVRLDPALDKLIGKETVIEIIADGFAWSEGPVWVKDSSYVLFSDIPNNTIYKWKEGEGLSVFLKPSGYTGRLPYSHEPGSNGLIINKQGQLVACEHGDRRISSMPLSMGGKRTLTDNYQGKRFNSPNDIIQRSNGDYYFTDPFYGLPKGEKDTLRETKVTGVYRLSTNGAVTLLISNLLPNGLAFSPDEKILYVGQSDPDKAIIMAYPVNADGNLGTGKLFFDATSFVKQGLKGAPDGMKVDNKGNLFSTGASGILIISPEGKLLGRLETTQQTANCAWGDDGSTLYITANSYLCRIRTLTKGAGF